MWIDIIWGIWDHRSNVVFRDEKVDEDELFHLAQLKA